MPRFFLHVCNGNGFVEDEEGHDLPDAEAARAQAQLSARDLMREELRSGQLNLASFIEVEDEHHNHLFTVQFSETIEIKT